jgi:hypothetical protein
VTEIDDEIRVARKCVRCGIMLYISMDDASRDAATCAVCRTGSLPAILEAPNRIQETSKRIGSLFSRSKADTAKVIDPKPPPITDPEKPVPDGAADFDQLKIIRSGNVNPTFTAEKKKPQYKLIVPIVAVLLIAGLGLGFLIIREPPQLPATPAGVATAWLLDAMNDSQTIDTSTIHENFSESAIRETDDRALLARIRGWDQRNDAYVVGRVIDAEDRYRLITLITTESMDWGELIVEVEESAPHQIRQFSIEPADPPR